jgi:hypothetical protein
MPQHDWIKSTLGHGELMCKRCLVTNREATALGILDKCEEKDLRKKKEIVRTFYKRQKSHIEKYGRSIVGVFADEDEQDVINHTFSYTIGNTIKGMPELLVFGIAQSSLLNHLSELMIKRDRGFKNNEIIDIGGKHPTCAIDADDEEVKKEFTIQAGRYLGHEFYRVQQIVIPDKNGLFPWQVGCAEPYSKVRIWRKGR